MFEQVFLQEKHSCRLSPSPFSTHATQEHGLTDARQGRPDRRGDRQHKRSVLFGAGPPVAAQLHLQV